jgi:hypothetical protein
LQENRSLERKEQRDEVRRLEVITKGNGREEKSGKERIGQEN